MYKEEFFINNVDLITGACIIMELIMLFAIFLFLLIKSWISQKKKWSSFSTLILMGHLLSLVLFDYPVERPMILDWKFKFVIITKTFKSLIISVSLFRDIELHRLLHAENDHKLHRSIGYYAHLLFLLVQSMFLGLLVLRKDRVSEWLQNYDVRTSIIGFQIIFFHFSCFISEASDAIERRYSKNH